MKTYTVKPNDSLSKIAKRELGDANRWPELQKLNDIVDADLIHPGQTLRIPGAGGFLDALRGLLRR